MPYLLRPVCFRDVVRALMRRKPRVPFEIPLKSFP
jgi:hypothetical protein